jgi:hypothetical protein
MIKPSQNKDEKKRIIREELTRIVNEEGIPPCAYLPTNQNCKVNNIITTSGAPLQSAARVPIMISFEVEDFEGPDGYINELRTDFLRSVMRARASYSFDVREKIQDALIRFKQQFKPPNSEEDIADEEFDFDISESIEDR